MLRRLTKFSCYFFKFLQIGSLKELKELYERVDSSIFLNALAARLDRRPFLANLKDFGAHEINTYLDLLPHRRKHIEEDLYTWEVNGKNLFANPTQFLGLYAEYLKGIFKSHYAFDWKNKVVLDVGGFVGDSALYFLENGAEKIVIYEPLAKNVKALKYNLKNYHKQIEVQEKAVAEQTGSILLASNEPVGSLGFGMEHGKYQIECEAVTFTQMLTHHCFDIAKIDCEGAEQYLVDVDENLIKSIPYWIIETHNLSVYQSINQLFIRYGFKKIQDFKLNSSVNLLHFDKINF